MPNPVIVAFSPRYNECAPDGQLYAATYVRWALEAAIEAGAAADLNSAELEAASWLESVGDIGVQIALPVHFGDQVEIQTQLSRSGPPIWRREFTFKDAESNTLLATAFVDVYQGDEAAAEDADDEQTEPDGNPAWDGPAPEPPERPKHAFRAVWRVGWTQLDISGQFDPGGLTAVVGDMEGRAAESRGWTAQRDEENAIAWRVGEHRLELFDIIRSGDILNIASYIGESGDDWMVRHTLIERGDGGIANEVARARTRWVCLSTTTGQPCPIPDDWLYDLADQMTEE